MPLFMKRFLLRCALGRRTYDYMCRSINDDKRSPRAYEIDIVVRKDGVEKRIEADWVKTIAKIINNIPVKHKGSIKRVLRDLNERLLPKAPPNRIISESGKTWLDND